MKDVFISYKGEEFSDAIWVKEILEKNGISCWMAPMSIPGGSNYAQEIPNAISECKIFVLLLSEKCQRSIWIPKELDQAINEGKVIMPFMVEDCALKKAFNFYLTNVQRYEAFASREDAMKKMIGDMRSFFGQSGNNNQQSDIVDIDSTTTMVGEARIPWKVYWKKGDNALSKKEYAKAEEYYKKAKHLTERIAMTKGTLESRKALALTCERLGDLGVKVKEFDYAEKYYQKADIIFERFAVTDNSVSTRSDYGRICEKKGKALLEIGNIDASEVVLTKALKIYERLAMQTGESDYRYRLSQVYDRLGDVETRKGNFIKARDYYQKCSAIVNALEATTK